MSSQKGNTKRARPQKYQNNHAFKNDLHDKSHQTKRINNIQVVNVCERCKKIIEWKIKYKKYKPLKAPAKCTKCEQKVIKHAYHIMCGPCALHNKVCPKCGEKGDVVPEEPKEETLKLDRELRLILKKLPERKRRTFMRYMNGKAARKEASSNGESTANAKEPEEADSSDSEEESQDPRQPLTRDDLLAKLNALMISSKRNKNEDDDDDFGSDFDGANITDDEDEDDDD
ncbi:uncharacterized protein C9orf85 homolog isoform X1 [Venturia canescens]|uniref:uncharacterized protein C9orf85 homolog isoform X1 n=1 Tax=Venturia canescens TaxID=32260 RepID=UPI001C9C0808|nr:uncharacterized protein C9orf85 homolog isoform X1 [Venturia canescens]XP_043281531.1 uncharacterized protein C9orf85 homolog isoform X1 [Venturia canescens]